MNTENEFMNARTEELSNKPSAKHLTDLHLTNVHLSNAHLDALEEETIFILREVAATFERFWATMAMRKPARFRIRC
jgi:sulfate adenylyltransferase subunit 2